MITEQTPPIEPEVVVPLTAEDIVVPEGFVVADELRDKFIEAINGDLSPKDRAQALVALQVEALTAASEASSAAWDTMQDQWKDEVKADPAFAGEKLQPALASIGKLVAEYGTPELTEIFNLTGAGNSIHMVKFLANIAQKLTEGGPAQGTAPTGEANAAQLLYPSMKG